MLYRVRWEIDIDADTPEQAARLALEIQRDVTSEATHFEIRERRGQHLHKEVIDVVLPVN